MLFFFKKPEVHIDCFSYMDHAYEFAPIDYAHKFYPDWWKKLPNEEYVSGNFHPTPTMKTCRGLIDNYRNSLMIPMWSDFILNYVNPTTHQWIFSDRKSDVESHPYHQRKGFLENYLNLKLIVPWAFKTKELIYWSYSKAFYNFEHPDEFLILPGVVEFKYQHGANTNLGIKCLPHPKEYRINHGQPLVQLTPHTEKKIKFKNHLVTVQEFQRIQVSSAPCTFTRRYTNNRRIMEEKESKCPFGFGKK